MLLNDSIGAKNDISERLLGKKIIQMKLNGCMQFDINFVVIYEKNKVILNSSMITALI